MNDFKWVLLAIALVGIAVAVRIIRQINRERAANIARMEAEHRAARDSWLSEHRTSPKERMARPKPWIPQPTAERGGAASSADDGLMVSQMGLMSGGSWPSPSSSYSGGGGTFDGGGASGDWSSSSSCSSSDSSSSSSDSGGGSCGGD